MGKWPFSFLLNVLTLDQKKPTTTTATALIFTFDWLIHELKLNKFEQCTMKNEQIKRTKNEFKHKQI